MKSHYDTFARYNRWANRRIYEAAASLPESDDKADRGAFFGSLHGTRNHIPVADRIWLKRITGEGAAPDRPVGHERKHDSGQDQEFARRQELVLRHQMNQPVQLFAGAEQKNRRHGHGDGDPRRLHERHGADHIGQQVGNGNHRRGRARSLLRRAPDMGMQPQGQGEQAGHECQRMLRLDQIEHRPRQGQQRECPHAAGRAGFVALVNLLERQAEKDGERQDQRETPGQLGWRNGNRHFATDPSCRRACSNSKTISGS
ncbi:MAG TPA: DinB family protein [Alphaproteobacteria bacterium]|nr:DinB family protein [Alphaproteobacteria bacterium]